MIAKILDFITAFVALSLAAYLMAILWVGATLRRRDREDETEEL